MHHSGSRSHAIPENHLDTAENLVLPTGFHRAQHIGVAETIFPRYAGLLEPKHRRPGIRLIQRDGHLSEEHKLGCNRLPIARLCWTCEHQ